MSELILKVIALVVSVASPELRKTLEGMLNNLEQQAKATKNPWDDILVGLIKHLILGDDKSPG